MDTFSAEAFLSLEFLIRMSKHDQAQGTDVLRHVEDLAERPGPVLIASRRWPLSRSPDMFDSIKALFVQQFPHQTVPMFRARAASMKFCVAAEQSWTQNPGVFSSFRSAQMMTAAAAPAAILA